jgi:hypothetical protein
MQPDQGHDLLQLRQTESQLQLMIRQQVGGIQLLGNQLNQLQLQYSTNPQVSYYVIYIYYVR